MRPSLKMLSPGFRFREATEGILRRAGPRWWVVPLVGLTTARFRDDPSIDRRIVERLVQLEHGGWLVRTAGPRNYVGWRSAAALDGMARVLVLPNRYFPFTHEERNVAILRDLVIAEFRVRQGPTTWAGRDRIVRVLAVLIRALYPHHPVNESHVERLLGRIDAKVNEALSAEAARRRLSPCRGRRSS